MSDEQVKLVKNLDKLLFDDAGETAEAVRQRLESEGIDVQGLVARVRAAAGQAYRETLVEEANEEQSRLQEDRGSIFGNLAELGRDKLLELVRAAAGGQYGAAITARCRNQQPEKLSDADLKSLLEDIEATIPK